jgi:hypothetical protein
VTDPATAIVQAEQPVALARPSDELSVEDIVSRVQKVQEVQRRVMRVDVHFGKIPGVDKPSLLKPGAEILGMVFRLDPEFEVTEQLREGDHLTVVIKCTLFHVGSGNRLGSGMGSCSTRESRYAYRKGDRTCPECGKAAIIKGKAEYGGGWVCFKKKDGCGAKFDDNAPAITSQQVGRIANDDLPDQHNTVLKMAIKRAHVAAILFVTCASEIFTQDVEDMRGQEEEAPGDPAPKAGQKASGARPQAAARPVQAVPSDADLQRCLDEIAVLQTHEALSEHAQANRNRRWNKVQIAELKRASDERRTELEDRERADQAL